MTRPNITTLQLFLGYCESERVSGILVARIRSKGFKTARGALRAFLRDCKAILLETESTVPICCQRADSNATYCPKCGSRLKKEVKITEDDLVDFLSELDGDLDGVGSEIIDALEEKGWSLGDYREGDWVSVKGMDYLTLGESPSTYFVHRFTVSNHKHIRGKNSKYFTLGLI